MRILQQSNKYVLSLPGKLPLSLKFLTLFFTTLTLPSVFEFQTCFHLGLGSVLGSGTS